MKRKKNKKFGASIHDVFGEDNLFWFTKKRLLLGATTWLNNMKESENMYFSTFV